MKDQLLLLTPYQKRNFLKDAVSNALEYCNE